MESEVSMRGPESIALVVLVLVLQLVVVLIHCDGLSLTPPIITSIVLIGLASAFAADSQSSDWFAFGDTYALSGGFVGDLAFIFGLIGVIVYANKHSNAAIAAAVAGFVGLLVALVCASWTRNLVLLTNDFPSQHEINNLYIMMEKYHYVMTQLGIPYWIIAGTLLGSCRHGGIMQWDDDIDVGMLSADIDTLFLHKDKLMHEGLTLGRRKRPNCIKLYFKQGGKTAFIDIFEHSVDGDAYVFTDAKAKRNYPKEKSMSKKIIEPIRNDYVYGPLRVCGPADGVGFLEKAFGSSVMTHYKVDYPHTNRSLFWKSIIQTKNSPELKPLDDETRKPRLPTIAIYQRK